MLARNPNPDCTRTNKGDRGGRINEYSPETLYKAVSGAKEKDCPFVGGEKTGVDVTY
jgi:hypothetical protein